MRSLHPPTFKEPGRLPEWGCIFSPYVCFVRPVDLFEEKSFLKLIDEYLSVLLSLVITLGADKINSSDTINRLNYQKRYCSNQKLNEKTRGILTKFFGSVWAGEYIDKILFDC